MQEFKVPSRSVETTLCLEGGVTVSGTLFVPTRGPDGTPGKLVDRLNDDEERFIPMLRDNRRELLNKDRIVWVRPEDSTDVEPPLPPSREEHHVRVILCGGAEIDGIVRFVMPPERSRLLDYLNVSAAFVAVEGAAPTLVNLRFIMRIEDMSGAAP